MERRNFLKGAVAGAGLIALNNAFPSILNAHPAKKGEGLESLISAVEECVKRGNLCIEHCVLYLGKGEKELSACLQKALEMEAVCYTLLKLTSYNSSELNKFCKTAFEFCDLCEKECLKHAKKHKVCKECAEACKRCKEECKKISI